MTATEKQFASDLAAVIAVLRREGRRVRLADLARRRERTQRKQRKPKA